MVGSNTFEPIQEFSEGCTSNQIQERLRNIYTGHDLTLINYEPLHLQMRISVNG